MKHIFVAFRDFKNTRGKERWKALGKMVAFLALLFFLCVAGIFAYFMKDLPSPSSVNSRFIAESTKIYDRSGNHILYDIHGEEKRTQISFQQMPESIRYATIALEDQNFYSNRGIEITSIVRAGIADILHRSAKQGASTITQQLIKQTVLSSEKTLTRKIKEAILSIELNQKFSKDDILGMYLNQIPYGSNTYGIEAAAQTFFGKHASELTLDESALLASLPKAPSYYSPYGSHTDGLKIRQEYALSQMSKLGYITQEQAEAAQQVDVFSKINPFAENISAPHFVMYIKEYLENKYGGEEIEKGGLRVYTTLDWDKQQIAEQAVKAGAEKNATTYGANNAALVAEDPKTGQILAMVGSKDYFAKSSPTGCITGKNCKFEGNFNVTTAGRQPGSSFKPFVYLTAFAKGYTPETMFWDVDTNFDTGKDKDYNPKNYDGKNRGPLQMKNALAMSLNVPAVETLYLAGVKESIDTASKMGITTLTEPDRYGLSLVLGGGEVRLIDHVNAFGTLANNGVFIKKTAILKIQDSSGNVLEEYKNPGGERVVEEKQIGMLDYILSTNDLRAPVFGDNNPLKFTDRPVAAKTGTTNEWRDGWTMGYTPSLVVGVWAGNNDNSPMAKGADGIYVAAPIWRSFMDQALKNYAVEQFPKYEKEETGKPVLDGTLDIKDDEVKVCLLPGKKDKFCLATDACPDKTVKKKEFVSAHSILYYVKKDDPRGDQPKNPEDDPQYKNWEEAVRDWVDDHEKDLKGEPAPEKECKSSDFENSGPSVSVKNPSDGDTIRSASFTISASASAGYGIKKLSISINGSEVSSKDSSEISYTYTAPVVPVASDLKIEASVVDDIGETDSSSVKIHLVLP